MPPTSPARIEGGEFRGFPEENKTHPKLKVEA
jgi:hypothetical protein